MIWLSLLQWHLSRCGMSPVNWQTAVQSHKNATVAHSDEIVNLAMIERCQNTVHCSLLTLGLPVCYSFNVMAALAHSSSHHNLAVIKVAQILTLGDFFFLFSCFQLINIFGHRLLISFPKKILSVTLSVSYSIKPVDGARECLLIFF